MIDQVKVADHTVTLRVRNTAPSAIVFWLGPWGEAYPMAPNATFDLVGIGPANGSFEVMVANDKIIVYGWSGSRVELFQDGTALTVQ